MSRALFVTFTIGLNSIAFCDTSGQGIAARQVQNRSRISSVRDLQQFFTPREVEVEILGIKAPEQFHRIHAKFIQSIREKGPWFLGYVTSHSQTGQPLPYHENFGITKDEYEQYNIYFKEIKLVPIAKGRLKFSEKSGDETVIDGVDGLHEFDGTVIDFKRGQVVTRWGTVELDRAVHTEESALGSWDGLSGSLQTGSIESGSLSRIRIDIGRQSETSLALMCLSVRVVQDGVKTSSVETAIRFP